MSVTLEVSRLSGWLKATAFCRVAKGGHIRYGARCGVRACGAEAARKRHSEGRPDSRLGARARAERTSNMPNMFVTLEVSQLEKSASKFRKL